MNTDSVFFDTTDFELGRELGEGLLGKVYIGKNLTNNCEYAAKLIKIDTNFNGYE